MKIDYVEEARQISNIVENKKIFCISSELIDELFYVRTPSSSLLHDASFIYKKKYDEALVDGLKTEEELLEFLHKNALFTKEDEEKIGELRGKITAMDLMLSKLSKNELGEKYKQIYLDKKLGFIQELNKLRIKRSSLMNNSAEHHAEAAKMQFLLPFCCFDIDNNRVWPTYKTFQEDQGSLILALCLTEFINFYEEVYDYKVRTLARCNEWRTKWRIANKISSSLFSAPIIQWTPLQITLCFWSSFYDNIYESIDTPPDWIIENDEECDKWLKQRHEENEKEKLTKFGRSGVSNNHDDIIIMGDKEYHFKEYAEKKSVREFNAINDELGIGLKQDIISGEIKEDG